MTRKNAREIALGCIFECFSRREAPEEILNDRLTAEGIKDLVEEAPVYQNALTPKDAAYIREVVVAAAMHADLCQIYTDVEGVYTADPRKVEGARKLKEITYDEMLELATLGAQVLNNRSVEMAKKYHIELEVLSSLTRAKGTIVKEATNVEKMLISGVAKDENVARISVIGVPDKPGLAFRIFSKLAQKNVNVDIILQSIGRNGTKDISFTVEKDKMDATIELMQSYVETIGASSVVFDDDVAKVSIVGAGMESHPGVASDMFEALFEANVNIQMISTSEIKISVLIKKEDANKAVAAIHAKFYEQIGQCDHNV